MRIARNRRAFPPPVRPLISAFARTKNPAMFFQNATLLIALVRRSAIWKQDASWLSAFRITDVKNAVAYHRILLLMPMEPPAKVGRIQTAIAMEAPRVRTPEAVEAQRRQPLERGSLVQCCPVFWRFYYFELNSKKKKKINISSWVFFF